MLPYAAAIRPQHYTKAVLVCVQQSEDLQSSKPVIFSISADGHHVIRRSDHYWAGLSSDIVIESSYAKSQNKWGTDQR